MDTPVLSLLGGGHWKHSYPAGKPFPQHLYPSGQRSWGVNARQTRIPLSQEAIKQEAGSGRAANPVSLCQRNTPLCSHALMWALTLQKDNLAIARCKNKNKHRKRSLGAR